ncbi:MAG: cell division suppressor protein YneA [Filifactoraceae bacterium]
MKKKKKILKKIIISRIYRVIGIFSIIFALTFTTSIIFSNLSKSIEASASNYIQISVSPGDTLWNIAKEYHTEGDIRNYISEIQRVNNLNTGSIFVDQKLYIPIKKI